MTPEKRYASENFKNSFVCDMKKIMLIIHCETDFGELFRPNGLEHLEYKWVQTCL